MGDTTIPAADGGTYEVHEDPSKILPLIVVHHHPDGRDEYLGHCLNTRAVEHLTASVDRISRASDHARAALDNGDVLVHPGCGIAG